MVTLFAYFIDGRGAGPPPSSSLRLTVVAPSISEELRSMCRVAPLVAFGMLCGGTEDESIQKLPVMGKTKYKEEKRCGMWKKASIETEGVRGKE